MSTEDKPLEYDRSKRIWVTELDSCPRKRYYRIREEDELPPHFDSVKGKVTHKIIEQILKGEDINPDYSDMPEAEPEIALVVNENIDNLNRWLEKTDIDLSQCEIEKKMVMPIRDDYVLVGTIDCLTPTHIIDFKSGVKKNTKAYRLQLAAYNKMMSLVDGNERQMLDVFLGGADPEECFPFESTRTPYDEAARELERLIDQRIEITERIKQGYSVPVQPGFLCVYCDYRHKCRGI